MNYFFFFFLAKSLRPSYQSTEFLTQLPQLSRLPFSTFPFNASRALTRMTIIQRESQLIVSHKREFKPEHRNLQGE